MNSEKANKLYKAKIEADKSFNERKLLNKLSVKDVILHAIENKKNSCYYEVIGEKNYQKIKKQLIWKGYHVKDAGFSRNVESRHDENGVFTLEIEW